MIHYRKQDLRKSLCKMGSTILEHLTSHYLMERVQIEATVKIIIYGLIWQKRPVTKNTVWLVSITNVSFRQQKKLKCL